MIKESNKMLQVVVSKDLYSKLDLFSKKVGISKSSVVVLALSEYLKKDI